MRSGNLLNPRVTHAVWPHARIAARVSALLVVALCTARADPQYDFSDEPLLPSSISSQNIELRGRWVREWSDDRGLVLMFNGGFRLAMGQRWMAAHNAVVWIESGLSTDKQPRKYFALTVYLSEEAEVHEAAGTVTEDNVLLVRGLRTFGQITRHQDAHAAYDMTDSPLYQQALRDKLLLESGEPGLPGAAEVVHPGAEAKEAAKPLRVVRYKLPNIEPAETADGEPVFVSTGGVYFSQAGGPDAAMLEIRADNAVVFPARDSAAAVFGEELSGEQRRPEPPAEPTQPRAPGAEPASDAEAVLGLGGSGEQSRVRAVYLEGDVVLSLGNRFVRAHRLYYDFERDRALILDAVFRADVPQREIPLYVRAAEIRQLSAKEFAADHALVTTSEFYTPSYHVGADRVYVRDLTRRDAEGRATGPVSGAYELRSSTLNVEGVPLLWWPYSKGRLESSETLLRSFSSGYSGRRGFETETRWHLFNLLGVVPPEGVDATLRMDYFSKRGPGVGIDVDYERENYYGLLRTYFINDQGRDKLGAARKDEEEPSTEMRGRALWRHRHYLPDSWEATIEAAYASDANYLEEWEKREWFEGKEQETALYLKRAKGNQAVTFLANWRLLDFVTQTEHMPEATYRRIGDTWFDPVVLYHESRYGIVRYLPDDRRPFDLFRRNDKESDLTNRGDVREEAELPLKVGAVNVVPFASIRGSYWDGQPRDPGAVYRGLATYGVRGSTSFSRVYDGFNSELLDIHRIRHIIKPDFALWLGHSNVRSEYLTPFDYGIETIDGFYGFTAGVRQTWQTKRGPEGRQRTVDLLTLNMEMGLFGNTVGRREESSGYANPLRPENSRTRNYAALDAQYRLSDSTSFLYDFNFDLDDTKFDQHNVAIAVERDPRLAYVLGTRYAGDVDLNYVGGGWNYKLTEKHFTAFRGWWDVDTGRVGEVTVSYVRKLPRWYVGINFEYTNLDDEFGISFSLWPEGIPEWTLGSKRFTTLGQSTGIRP